MTELFFNHLPPRNDKLFAILANRGSEIVYLGGFENYEKAQEEVMILQKIDPEAKLNIVEYGVSFQIESMKKQRRRKKKKNSLLMG